jgi:hypothetical protein
VLNLDLETTLVVVGLLAVLLQADNDLPLKRLSVFVQYWSEVGVSYATILQGDLVGGVEVLTTGVSEIPLHLSMSSDLHRVVGCGVEGGLEVASGLLTQLAPHGPEEGLGLPDRVSQKH